MGFILGLIVAALAGGCALCFGVTVFASGIAGLSERFPRIARHEDGVFAFGAVVICAVFLLAAAATGALLN